MIKAMRDKLGQSLNHSVVQNAAKMSDVGISSAPVSRMFSMSSMPVRRESFAVHDKLTATATEMFVNAMPVEPAKASVAATMPIDAPIVDELPLGRIVGQVGNKYIIAQKEDNMVVVDQHAAHERITYEKLRTNKIKSQPLLTPIVINLREEDVAAVVSIADELKTSGLQVDAFGDAAIAIFEKPADWDLDWAELLRSIADEVRENGHSSQLNEKLHLKLANYACHHSVRAGQKLDMIQMDALLRDIERTERTGQCNHGRPVYKFIPLAEIDSWFERL